MWPLERQAREWVAEHIQFITAVGRLGADLQLPLDTHLPGARAGPKMGELLRQRHRDVVTVMGVVKYLVVRAHVRPRPFVG
ncbi:hypothetical protein D3C81_1759910 [compost metagenome]